MSETDFGDDLLPAERQAAEWVMKHVRGLRPAEEELFQRWLKQDLSHSRIYAEMAETSRLLDAAGQVGAPAHPVAFSAASSPVEVKPRPARVFTWLAVSAALAAALTIGVFVRRGPSPSAAAQSATAFSEAAATQIGDSRHLTLPDGSTVQLNTDTAIEVAYLPEARRITLVRGEAFFTVAKDSKRPFWVKAGPVAVRAVGTEFNVRVQSEAVDVVVAEGVVRVVQPLAGEVPSDTLESAAVLALGQSANVAVSQHSGEAHRHPVVVSTLDPAVLRRALAWRDGGLEFSDTPLADVAAEFNRYNRRQIVIADASLARRRFGGAFASHQPEPLLELLEQSFGAVCEVRGEQTVVRVAK